MPSTFVTLLTRNVLGKLLDRTENNANHYLVYISVHIAEGILPIKQVMVTTGLAAPIVAFSAYHLHKMLSAQRALPASKSFLTMSFTLCFAATLLPIPVPVAGATSHMCATPLLALLIGPSALPAVTAAILLLQALFFAHGGITTLGANTLTLGVVGPAATLCVFYALKLLRVPEKARLASACFLGSLSVYLADSLLLAWSFMEKQPFAVTFRAVLLGFLPVQTPLSFFEGLISATVLVYLRKHVSDVDFLTKQLKTNFDSALIAIGLIVLVALASPASFALGDSSFQGLDDALFAKTAVDLGAKPSPLFPWLKGEVELAAFSFGFLISGFILGRSYTRWHGEHTGSLGMAAG